MTPTLKISQDLLLSKVGPLRVEVMHLTCTVHIVRAKSLKMWHGIKREKK